MLATRPRVEDLVVAHGDYTPSNVLLPASGEPVIIDVPAEERLYYYRLLDELL